MSDFSRTIGKFYDDQTKRSLNKEFYEGSDFANYGYWRAETKTAREACENLMDELLRFIPQKEGKILDVACGNGATSRHLLNHYQPTEVVGINVSPEQLKACERNAPGCTFMNMDATNMSFDDDSFDNMICVEAAFHFETREKFFAEALRVLKKGGRLVLADILMPASFSRQPAANIVADLNEYEQVCRRAGFAEVEVLDVTEFCVGGYFDHSVRFAERKASEGQMRPFIARALSMLLKNRRLKRTYLLATCTK